MMMLHDRDAAVVCGLIEMKKDSLNAEYGHGFADAGTYLVAKFYDPENVLRTGCAVVYYLTTASTTGLLSYHVCTSRNGRSDPPFWSTCEKVSCDQYTQMVEYLTSTDL